MSTSRITSDYYLLWPDTQLVKCLSNNPAIYLEAVTERNREWILWCKSIVYREDDGIVFFHHVGPLSRVARVLVAAHAHKSSSMKVQYDFLNFVL